MSDGTIVLFLVGAVFASAGTAHLCHNEAAGCIVFGFCLFSIGILKYLTPKG